MYIILLNLSSIQKYEKEAYKWKMPGVVMRLPHDYITEWFDMLDDEPKLATYYTYLAFRNARRMIIDKKVGRSGRRNR